MTTVPLPAFITGWRKLPDELKLNILGLALPPTVNPEDVSGAFYQYGLLGAEKDIRSLLMCREISGLVMEALYSRSVVEVCDVSSFDKLKLSMTGVLTVNRNFKLPPVAARRYIRHLSVTIERLGPRSFGALAGLSTAMPALQKLDIKIQEVPSSTTVLSEKRKSLHDALKRMPHVKFDAKKLDVTYYHTNVTTHAAPPVYNRLLPDDNEKPLLDYLSIDGKNLKERMECELLLRGFELVNGVYLAGIRLSILEG
jgi:hypothetical protein